MQNELHKPIIRKFKRRRVYSSFKDNNHLNTTKECKYAWVVTLKDKKGITIVNAVQSILDSSKRKPNKTWVDKSSAFYNSPFKICLKEHHKEIVFNIHLLKDLLEPFFAIWVFFHEHSRSAGEWGKGEAISSIPLYHFDPHHRHLDISGAIAADSSPLHLASSRTRAGNL